MRLETVAKPPILIAVGALAIGVALTLLFYFENSKVLKEAVQIAATHPVVVEALGTPIERSGLLGKRWRSTERLIGKRYDRDVPIAGPKGKGVLRITVTYQTVSRNGRSSRTRYKNEELVGLRFQAAGTDHWQDLLADERPSWATETDPARGRAAADETPPPPPPPGGWVPLKPPPDGTPEKGPPVKPAEPAPQLKNW
ncbi:MAG TPA: hypothetical protein DFS52_06095 [Myxococcales bacterium]|nr:hypothetical protein [Myxococcales bacterium]